MITEEEFQTAKDLCEQCQKDKTKVLTKNELYCVADAINANNVNNRIKLKLWAGCQKNNQNMLSLHPLVSKALIHSASSFHANETVMLKAIKYQAKHGCGSYDKIKTKKTIKIGELYKLTPKRFYDPCSEGVRVFSTIAIGGEGLIQGTIDMIDKNLDVAIVLPVKIKDGNLHFLYKKKTYFMKKECIIPFMKKY